MVWLDCVEFGGGLSWQEVDPKVTEIRKEPSYRERHVHILAYRSRMSDYRWTSG